MLNKNYWQTRYAEKRTGWDAGNITTPIKEYFDTILNKNARILIPGCGNAHEATYLFAQGFKNIFLCDWAQSPLDNFALKNPEFPQQQLICRNFFELNIVDFDYVIEQTFFCAINPSLRKSYAKKVFEILKHGGTLFGLLFGQALDLNQEGPPYGGSKDEYLSYFEPIFSKTVIEECQNSIAPRQGVELFIEIVK